MSDSEDRCDCDDPDLRPVTTRNYELAYYRCETCGGKVDA